MPADLIERLREAGVAASDGHAFGRPDTEDVLWWIDKHADKVLRVLLAARLEEMGRSDFKELLICCEEIQTALCFNASSEVAGWRNAILSLLAPEVPRGK